MHYIKVNLIFCTLGFCRGSERSLTLYSVKDLSTPVHTLTLNVAPSILIPYYDEDTGVLLLSGKVWSFILAYIVVNCLLDNNY